jgi:asparagine synthase (glutamine-hydrolysing)
MCGFTGFWDFKKQTSKEKLLAYAEAMSSRIKERGPDSGGSWCDEVMGIALGHRRLAIVDLSEAGHQPMISSSGRSVMVYNGEIFNATELRKELIANGCRFRGYSDTEVILEACEAWGVAAACQRFIGMFTFAFWDNQQKKLFLARDRLGIKPLYWGFNRGILFFGSQVKSFIEHPSWSPSIDKDALTAYFRFNYIPAPLSIFEDIYKIFPGTVLSVDEHQRTEEVQFWNFQKIAQQGISMRSKRSDSILIKELDTLLRDAIGRRMVAEVPLGAFLSGGIDSSTVVALMQAQSLRPVQTFSIGFHETEFDEAKYAAQVAKHLGTEHHEWYLTAEQACEIIAEIPNWFDEPFADVSQIPTFLVSRLARQFVTVTLSGDGGDELFAGYNRYFLGQAFWQRLKLLPHWLRCMSAYGIERLSPKRWDNLAQLIPRQFRPALVGDKAYKFAGILKATKAVNLYRSLVSHWDNPAELVVSGSEPDTPPWSNFEHLVSGNFLDTMQIMDTLTYLPDDILTKVDRASMAVSLEARVPLLDHRLVEFAWSLSQDTKIREGKGKWLLRQVLNQYVPQHLIERPKMGFGVPIGDWLKGPLREWTEALLSESKLREDGLLNPTPIRQRWHEHLSGKRNWQYSLWGVLMFQTWKARWYI